MQTAAGAGFRPDPPAVALDDVLADGKAEPGGGGAAAVLLHPVETLEHAGDVSAELREAKKSVQDSAEKFDKDTKSN